MRKTIAELVAIAMLTCLFAVGLWGCGADETPAKPAADIYAAAGTQKTSASTETEPEMDDRSRMLNAISEVTDDFANAGGFNHHTNYEASGSIDGIAVEIEGDYSWEQPSVSQNIHAWYNNSAETEDKFEYQSYDKYYTDGVYYGSADNGLVICGEPNIAPQKPVGGVFLDVLTRTEWTEVDGKELSCSFPLSGADLKAVIDDLCPTISSEIPSTADWSQVHADFFVNISQYFYFEDLTISSPELGKLLLSQAKNGAEAECDALEIDIRIDYKSTFVGTPYKTEEIFAGTPGQLLGMNRIIKQAIGAQEEQFEIEDEKKAAEDFDPSQAVSDGNGIILTTNNISIGFTMPTEIRHYNKIDQSSPERAIMVHDIFTNNEGRTIIEFLRGTPEEYMVYRSVDADKVETIQVGDREVLRYKTENLIKPEGTQGMYANQYVFATAIGNTVLGFCVDVTYPSYVECDIDENIIEVLLDHCILP